MTGRCFSDPQQQCLYDLRLSDPAPGKLNGLGAAYHNGLTFPDKPSRYVRTSLAYAAWAAGVDTARKERNA